MFVQEIGKIFNAGVAIDDIVLTECGLKPAQDSCDDAHFHCQETMVSKTLKLD